MADDDAKARYFGGLSIFMFSMIGITLADNLIMIFVFWELVGFSSYLLIAHYFKTDEAAKASRKAFIVNRVGDFGFLLGIIFTYWSFGRSISRSWATAIKPNTYFHILCYYSLVALLVSRSISPACLAA